MNPVSTSSAQFWLQQICLWTDGKTLTQADQKILVCEQHFEEAALNKSNPNKRRLNLGAVPTLKLPKPGINISSLTVIDVSKTTKQSEKRKSPRNALPKSLKKMKLTQCKNLDGGAVLSLQLPSQSTATTLYSNPTTSETPELNPSTYNTQAQTQNHSERMIEGAGTYTLKIHELQTQIKQMSESSKSQKQLALNLYLRFPNEYNVLYELLGVPHKSQLKDVFNDCSISSERGSLFSIYFTRKSMTMTDKQRQCFISLGESKIKPRMYYDIKRDHLIGIHAHEDVLQPVPATTAVVLILQGIFEKWKQPIAISYLRNNSPSIRPWVIRNIKNLHDIGYDVRAIVTHKDSKYFNKDTYILKGKKIYCLSDLSSQFTSFYYNFTKCGYVFNGFPAKIQYIKEYFELDSNREIPITPKLSDKILNPKNIEEVNIKSVMEVFNMTTAAGMSAYIDFNLIDVSAKNTVALVTKMHKLYDILSAGSWDGESGNEFTAEESQIEFLREMHESFEDLRLIECSLPIKSIHDSSIEIEASHINGIAKFKMLIKSMLSMSEYLKCENYESIPLGRLTNDAVELFFHQVQNHSKSITKPTAREVSSIFRQTAIINLLKKPANVTLAHIDDVFTAFQNMTDDFISILDSYTTDNDISTSLSVNTSDYATLDMGRKDGIIFMAGFLLKKCANFHKNECMDLKNYITKTSYDVETLSMCESIMDDVRKNICDLPSAQFIEIVESMEILFRAFMNKETLSVINKKFLNSLLMKVTENIDNMSMPCKCFPIGYMKKLYMRFRIYHTLKYNNELYRTKLNSGRLIVNKL